MVHNGQEKVETPGNGSEPSEVIRQLREDIENGKHWYIALLEAIRRWGLPEEIHGERQFCYLIADEAFDWLVLAERLCLELESLIPAHEATSLLFSGEPPLDLSLDQFKELIGPVKYRAYLNFLYGVTVEEALIYAVEQEVQKEQMARCYREDRRVSEDIYQRIYGATQTELLRRFRAEKGREQSTTISLGELKEFTYWLFKERLRRCDKARIASDTRKALDHLRQQRELQGLRQQLLEESTRDTTPPEVVIG